MIKTAKKIKKSLKGKKISFVNVEKILNELGYSVVFFNNLNGDFEIERYNLQKERDTLKSFTYCETVHIVFIDGNQHPEDWVYLALHELGHICLGHVGDGKLITRNKILIDIEADNFAYSIINGNTTKIPYNFIASIILSFSIVFGVCYSNTKSIPAVVQDINSEQENVTVGDIVWVTSFGTRFHREDCYHIKGSNITEMYRSEALHKYIPCADCNP